MPVAPRRGRRVGLMLRAPACREPVVAHVAHACPSRDQHHHPHRESAWAWGSVWWAPPAQRARTHASRAVHLHHRWPCAPWARALRCRSRCRCRPRYRHSRRADPGPQLSAHHSPEVPCAVHGRRTAPPPRQSAACRHPRPHPRFRHCQCWCRWRPRWQCTWRRGGAGSATTGGRHRGRPGGRAGGRAHVPLQPPSLLALIRPPPALRSRATTALGCVATRCGHYRHRYPRRRGRKTRSHCPGRVAARQTSVACAVGCARVQARAVPGPTGAATACLAAQASTHGAGPSAHHPHPHPHPLNAAQTSATVAAAG